MPNSQLLIINKHNNNNNNNHQRKHNHDEKHISTTLTRNRIVSSRYKNPINCIEKISVINRVSSSDFILLSPTSLSAVNNNNDHDHLDNDNQTKNSIISNTAETTTSLSSSNSNSNTKLLSWMNLLFNNTNTDLIAIVVIYFVEGALGIARLAQTLVLKDELQLGPAELSALSGLFVLPWTIKPIYGFLSDSIPLFGYRRKSYLIFAGIIGTISYTLLGQQGILWDNNNNNININNINNNSPTTSFPITIILLLISSACIAFSDVVADGIIVTKSRSVSITNNPTSTTELQNKILTNATRNVNDTLEDRVSSKYTPSTTILTPATVTDDSIHLLHPVITRLDDEDDNDDATRTTSMTATTADTGGGSAANLQSLCWGASAIGSLLSAYYSGSILDILTPRQVFGLTAILPFAVAAISTTINEQPVVVIDNVVTEPSTSTTTTTSTAATTPTTASITPVTVLTTEAEISQTNITLIADSVPGEITLTPTTVLSSKERMLLLQDTVSQQIQAVRDAFSKPEIWKPTLFLFLWQSTPTSGGAFLYFIMNDLHITTDTLGRLQFATALSTLVGVILYNKFLQTISIRSILLWTTLLSLPLGIVPPIMLITHINREYNIPDVWLLYGDDVVLAALGQISFLPTLVIAAKLCPPGIEAVLFATLMSIYNLAGTVGTEVGAILTKLLGITESNFDNLILLTIICNLSSVWPLTLINWLNDVDNNATTDNDNEHDSSNDSINNNNNNNRGTLTLVEASAKSVDNTTTVLL